MSGGAGSNPWVIDTGSMDTGPTSTEFRISLGFHTAHNMVLSVAPTVVQLLCLTPLDVVEWLEMEVGWGFGSSRQVSVRPCLCSGFAFEKPNMKRSFNGRMLISKGTMGVSVRTVLLS